MRAGDARVRDRQAWLGGYLNLLSRQHDASTAAPVIDRGYQRLHDAVLSGPRHDVLDFLSVRYILTQRDLSAFGYANVASHRGVAVFERQAARPMVGVEFAPRRLGADEDALDALMRDSIGDGVIATGLANEYPPGPPPDARADVGVPSLSLDSAKVAVEITHPALLVLNQTMRDGWSVRVDGVPRRTIRVNALFRGVELDKGRHEVEWTYRPRSLRAGIFVTLVAMCALGLEWRRVRGIRKKMSRSFHSEHA